MNTNESRGPILGKVLMTVFFIILCILFLIPLYALVLGTFKGGAELFVSGLNLNLNFSQLHTKAWRYLFTGIMSNGEYNPHDYFLWYRNSLMVVLVQGSLTLLLSSMVAYGLAKYEFKGKNVIFMCVLMVMMVPLEILMLPMYTQVNAMGMRNTYAGVMLPFLVSMSAVFFFRQFLTGIPYEMIEAARVDGCTEYGIFFRIIMPLMKPSFAAMGIFVGMNSWNSFILPVLLLTKDNRTLPVFLETLLSPYKNNYDLLIVGAVFSVIPIVILFALFQRHFIAGMTAGGVKG